MLRAAQPSSARQALTCLDHEHRSPGGRGNFSLGGLTQDVSFQHLFAGLTNRSLRPQIAELIPGYTTGQMTYDLRRLRRKGLIRRIPRSQRYELTAFGRRTAVFFTKTHVRIVNPSLAELDPQLPEEIANQHPLARAWRAFEQALDQRIEQAAIAA